MNPNFASLVLGLAAQAEQALSGNADEKAAGIDGRSMAQMMIDTLAMLEEKTRGNLDPGEKQLLERVLTDLRFKFVQSAGKSGT